MRRPAALFVAACFAAITLPTALARPPADLPALTRIASRLSGIPARGKLRAEVVPGAQLERMAARNLDREYPPAQQAYDEELYRTLGLLGSTAPLRPILLHLHVEGVQGLYDPSTRTAYVRRGPGYRAALLPQLVHALQDQAFGLKQLQSLRRDSRDAGSAAAAAVDGGAAFASIQSARALSSHGGSRIHLFLQLEAAFPRTTGARFASALHGLGGRTALFGALRRFPETTEQIFHIDAFLAREQPLPIVLPDAAAGFTLQRDDSFGELDVRALLAVLQVPRLDHVGEGWGGGRTALYTDAAGRRAFALVLSWDEPADAAEWAEAVTTYVNEAFEPDVPGQPATAPCASERCWDVGGRSIAFVRNRARTALVFGPSVAAADVLARALVVPS